MPLIDGERKRPRTAEPPAAAPAPHGVELPGGNLHRPATAHEPGFMLPEHLARIAALEHELVRRPLFFPDHYALRSHDHPRERVEDAPAFMRLVHATATLGRQLDDIVAMVKCALERPVLDPNDYATRDHRHLAVLVPHSHDEVEQRLAIVEQRMDVVCERIDAQQAQLARRLALLEAEAAFVRRVAEQALEYRKSIGDAHGNHQGGPLHALVSDRLAGFMSPDHKRRLESLWAKVMGGAS